MLGMLIAAVIMILLCTDVRLHFVCDAVTFNPLTSEGDLCGHINQSVRYVHSCSQLAILITRTTNMKQPQSEVSRS